MEEKFNISGEELLNSLRGDAVQNIDEPATEAEIHGKTVLVTGGGGSIGSELCRKLAVLSPKTLIVLDVYENSAYTLMCELKEAYSRLDVRIEIASIRDNDRMRQIFDTYKPEIVFHAAAHKHVPLMEDCPGEAIKNNIFATYNLAVLANDTGVKKFVLISTDKAVNPTSVMGASKKMCEMIMGSLQKNSKCQFVTVRFGNVLGSAGSVLHLFKRQIELGGPVTVTHPEITRYFMTIPQAAELVLMAAAFAKGGEIFVLDMGEQIKILDLAKRMIELSGKDIKVEFTGIRPGEKLYEELTTEVEDFRETDHKKILVTKGEEISPKELEEKLLQLKAAQNDDEMKQALKRVVPTYK